MVVHDIISPCFRRGFLIIRRLSVLLNAEKVFRQLSNILQSEADLEFASLMVQVVNCISSYSNINKYDFGRCAIV